MQQPNRLQCLHAGHVGRNLSALLDSLEVKLYGFQAGALSTSGWIIHMLTMRAAGIDPEKDLKQVVEAGSHNSVAAAV